MNNQTHIPMERTVLQVDRKSVDNLDKILDTFEISHFKDQKNLQQQDDIGPVHQLEETYFCKIHS